MVGTKQILEGNGQHRFVTNERCEAEDSACLTSWQADLSFDQGFNDLFVMLDRVDVHCIWVSDRVLDLLPSQLPEKIPGGEIPAKGVFCDNAMDIVLNHYPKPNPARKATFAKNAMRELNRLGIVGMHDAGVVPSDLNLYTQLASDNDWTVRVYAMIECDVRNTFCPEEVKKISTNNGKLHVRGVKLFAGKYFSTAVDSNLIQRRWSIGKLGKRNASAVYRQTGFFWLPSC